MAGMVPREARKGRGAASNRAGRYEPHGREAADDGWGALDEPQPPLRTTVAIDASRTIIARNTSPDVPFDRSINAYRGCEHGCVYCFARPTHAFLGLSPGQDFETRLFAKPDAPRLLRDELARPGYRCEPIALGTNTDPYQPIERRFNITRGILEVLLEHRHPVTITTKSALVTRDLDILGEMAELGLAKAFLSVTTLDRRLANRLEPRASTPDKRLEAIRALAAAGVPAGVMVAPVIPGLTDPELESILLAAARAGAREAGWLLLRLPLEVRGLFEEWLAVHAPAKAKHVLALVRETRDGRMNDPRFGHRHRGEGAYAALIGQRFAAAVRRLGLNLRTQALDTTRFTPPREQMSLF